MIRKIFEMGDATCERAAMPADDTETKPVSVSIVIPVFNSEGTIDRLCEALIDTLALRWRLQIVLVDDGSMDNSAFICRSLHQRHPEIVTCVILSRNFGEHNAVMAGLNFVTGDYCAIMDDDFQNPPEQVEAMLTEALKGFDVVYVRYPAKKHSLWRNVGSSLHNWMATHALQKPKGLYLSSFKLMSRFVVREIVQYTGPDPYLDAMILRATRNIGTITVKHQAREEGHSGYTFRKLLALWSNMMVTFSVYPLRIIGIYGLIMAGVGLVYGGFTAVSLWVSATDATDLEQLNASMWILRGSTLLMISIIGEYVGRIHRRLNAAPQFIIRHSLQLSDHVPQHTIVSPQFQTRVPSQYQS